MPADGNNPEKTTCVIAGKVRPLRTAAGYAIAIGPLLEHVPEFARR